jgi:hypothetical protein
MSKERKTHKLKSPIFSLAQDYESGMMILRALRRRFRAQLKYSAKNTRRMRFHARNVRIAHGFAYFDGCRVEVRHKCGDGSATRSCHDAKMGDPFNSSYYVPAAPECGGIEDAYGAEACLGADNGV